MLCLILVSGIVFLNSCSHDTDEPDTDVEQEIIDETTGEKVLTIENVLVSLIPEGYQETDEGYVISSFADDVSSKRVLNAKGNNLTAKLSYNYGNNQNEDMKDFFKTQDEAVCIMVSGILAKLASEADTDEGSMDYSIYVGGDLIREGTMSLEDARYYQTLAVE